MSITRTLTINFMVRGTADQADALRDKVANEIKDQVDASVQEFCADAKNLPIDVEYSIEGKIKG